MKKRTSISDKGPPGLSDKTLRLSRSTKVQPGRLTRDYTDAVGRIDFRAGKKTRILRFQLIIDVRGQTGWFLTCNCIPVYDRLTFSSDLTLKWPSKDIWLYYVYDPKFFIKVPIKPTSSSKWNKFDVIIPKNMPLQKITPSRFQKMAYSDRPI